MIDGFACFLVDATVLKLIGGYFVMSGFERYADF
jgi:hypothetical protein